MKSDWKTKKAQTEYIDQTLISIRDERASRLCE